MVMGVMMMVKMEREMAAMEAKGMKRGIEVGTHRGKNNIMMSCRARGRGFTLSWQIIVCSNEIPGHCHSVDDDFVH